MNSGKLPIPDPQKVSEFRKDFPYVFISGKVFPLKPFLIKPYSRNALALLERIFNYRLSRARRIVENVFGITSYTVYNFSTDNHNKRGYCNKNY